MSFVNSRNPDPQDSISADGLDELSLEDTLSQKMRGIPVKTRTPVTGYNPYDAVPKGKSKEAARKPTDLRKLSEHIKKMRELEERKRNNPDED